jgi:hypothetical protein
MVYWFTRRIFPSIAIEVSNLPRIVGDPIQQQFIVMRRASALMFIPGIVGIFVLAFCAMILGAAALTGDLCALAAHRPIKRRRV